MADAGGDDAVGVDAVCPWAAKRLGIAENPTANIVCVEAEGVADGFEGEDVGAIGALEPLPELARPRRALRLRERRGIRVHGIAQNGENEALLTGLRLARADYPQRQDQRIGAGRISELSHGRPGRSAGRVAVSMAVGGME